MNRTNDPVRNHPRRSRRETLGLLGVSAALLGAAALTRPAFAADDEVLTEALVLRDPEIPAAGNVDGDITIVEWFDYNCKTELSRDQIRMLADECASAGIEFMASVFDVPRIQWLEDVGMKRYKIASRSIFENDLIDAVAATGKPMIVSLGKWVRPGFPDIQAKGGVHYLYCIAKYPPSLNEVHLGKADFNLYAGFSDHTIGTAAPLAAMARGARIIEKHFTLDKNMFGPDHSGSATPAELTQMCAFRDQVGQILA